ncbi:MAG: ChbG/HpnK family deacetylase [Clostridia bacterium]|nr:ChbG/HpnK family deacetylase [Clostridia bacterium]
MIYVCADDYGLCEDASFHIMQCVEKGAINKVSVFPNFGEVDLGKLPDNTMISLHLNLVEGKCLANPDEITLLVDENGKFKNTFIGLLKLNLLDGKKFKKQVYTEILAQVKYWKSILPTGTAFCVDSHQHTHMIPGVFEMLILALRNEKIDVKYMRIPAEPTLPFIKTPSLYFTYSGINVIKQWLLKFLWTINKKHTKDFKIPTALFFGILFSGKMDGKRVKKVLPEFIKKAEKERMDIEVLFHPGYVEADNLKNTVFDKFYLSDNRKAEFDSVMEL